MSLTTKITSFYKRWNVEADVMKEFDAFKNRLLSALDYSVGNTFLQNPNVASRYAMLIGKRQPCYSKITSPMTAWMGITGSFDNTGLFHDIANANNETEVALSLQCMFWVLTDNKPDLIDNAVGAVSMAIANSPFAGIKLGKTKTSVFVFPQGAKMLDDKIVNDDLNWLSRYPKVAKLYGNSLSIYLGKDKSKYSALLDGLRKVLETLVREILGNRKSLENQKVPLLAWLKDRGCHVQIRNMYLTLLSYFCEYQNDAVKHGDKWSEREIEYMIYLTGTFMRLLLTLKDET